LEFRHGPDSNSIAWVLAFFASVLGNILAHDICSSADRICTKIIRSAARRLADFDRQDGELEWLADLHDRETVREKYQHAIGCFLVVGKMRRQAMTVRVAMNFQIDGVGTVPLTLNLTSRFMGPAFFAFSTARFDWIKSVAVVIGMLYVLLKFIRSANASLARGYITLTASVVNDPKRPFWPSARLVFFLISRWFTITGGASCMEHAS
jgi:hypothetical protein